MTRAKLYYETHVTTEALSPELREKLRGPMGQLGYKQADFLMQKDEAGNAAPAQDPNSFFSARGTLRQRVEEELRQAVKTLQAAGVRVKRYKIEDTVLDSKHEGDPLRIGGIQP